MKINEKWLQINGKYECPYCTKQYTRQGICTHILRTHLGINPKNTGHTKNKGKQRPASTKKKISNSLKGKSTGIASTPEKELLRRQKLSEYAKSRKNFGGYVKGSGRGKQGRYKGIWCDSSWELAFVIYHLDHNIPFERNWNKFEYQYEGQTHLYVPDFVYPDGTYIEVK